MKLNYAVEGRLFATNIEIKLVFLTTDITNYLRKMYVEIGANDCIRIVCQAQPPVVLILMSEFICLFHLQGVEPALFTFGGLNKFLRHFSLLTRVQSKKTAIRIND